MPYSRNQGGVPITLYLQIKKSLRTQIFAYCQLSRVCIYHINITFIATA